VSQALDAFLDGLELDTADRVRAAAAAVLAAQLDACRAAGTAAAASAAPRVAERLLEIVAQLAGAETRGGVNVRALLAEVLR